MPFSVQRRTHSYTIIPKVLYVHRQGMKRWRVSMGPINWTPN